MKSKNRLDYLDMAKGFGMLFVLIGHLQGDTIFQLSPYFHPLCVFIFAFHMPLFFIISGILMSIREESIMTTSLKSQISKRFKGIMIPYFWFSLFYFSVVIYAFIKGSIAYQTVLVNLWYVLSGYGMNVLWFLPALFFGEILFLVLRRRLSNKSFNIVIPVIFAAFYTLAYYFSTLSYDTSVAKRLHELVTLLMRPFLVCGWIFVGYTLHNFISGDNHLSKWINKADSAILSYKNKEDNSSLSSSLMYRSLYILIGIIGLVICAVLSKVNNGVDFRSLVLRNAFFYILCSLLGSYGLISLCKGLPRINLISFWGINSLVFMAVHNSETILFYALKLSMFVNQYLTHARGYICYLIILAVILIYTSLMIIVINRFFPFILGKSQLKK